MGGYLSTLPGPKTTLTLYKKTITASASGGQSLSTSSVQTLAGSLQPANAKEIAKYNKETTIVDWKFYVSKNVFVSSANETELKTKGYLTQTSPSRTFDIVGVEDWAYGNFYKVLLQERK